MKAGSRVGAILSSTDEAVHLIGYGVYDGDFEHPGWGFPNPRITLDNGNIVWGCECWWGDEEKVKASIAGRKVIDAVIDRQPAKE